jgi:hypothetical protein
MALISPLLAVEVNYREIMCAASRCSVNLFACSQRPKWKLTFINDSLILYVGFFY